MPATLNHVPEICFGNMKEKNQLINVLSGLSTKENFMKDAPQEEIERNLKGWAGMLKDEPTMDRDGKLVPPAKVDTDTKQMRHVPSIDGGTRAVCVDTGWLYLMSLNGQWVKERILADWEIMQIVDGILEGDCPEI